jgi:hypothetical protein
LQYKEKVPQAEPKEWTWDKDFKDKTICNPEIGEQYITKFSQALALEINELLIELGINFKPQFQI